MKFIDGNIVDFTFEDRGESNLYDVKMSFNMIPYIGVYSYYTGFIYSSLENKEQLAIIAEEIKKVLKEI